MQNNNKFIRKKSSNVVWHQVGIKKADRENKNKHKGIVVWFTGLPSSGKSTIATELQNSLFKLSCQVYILDGDNIRHGLNGDLGFSAKDREENIRRIGEVAKLFADAGFIVMTSFISPYRKDRDRARSLMDEKGFVEVFVKTNLDECERRDPKGLYKKARSGEIPQFTGISAPYQEPENPEIIVDTQKNTKEECSQQILDYLIKNSYILAKAKP